MIIHIQTCHLCHVAADVGGKGRRGRRSDLSKATGSSRWSENEAAFTAIKPVRDVTMTFDDKPDQMTSPLRRKYRSSKMAAASGKRSLTAVKLLRRTMLHKAPPGVKPEGGTDSLDADIDVESVSQGSCYFSFAYPFPDVAALMDFPYISRFSAVRPNLQTLAPHIQSSTSWKCPRKFWNMSLFLCSFFTIICDAP